MEDWIRFVIKGQKIYHYLKASKLSHR